MMTNNRLPLVTICCITYNHESYIRQCLDGFVMQKTNFPYEVIIHDDASTDNTADIIREYEAKYPEIIKPIYQSENQYSKRVEILSTFLFPRAKAKYIALCEGDDYWTDSFKLQKQVDYMEGHDNCTLCFHNAVEHYEDENIKDKEFSALENRDYSDMEIYNKWIVPTASVLIRDKVIKSVFFKKVSSNKNFIYGDIILFLTAARFGKIHCLPESMSVYRRHSNGVTFSISVEKLKKLAIHYREVYLVFGKKYKKKSKQIICSCYLRISYRSKSFYYFYKSILIDPATVGKLLFNRICFNK